MATLTGVGLATSSKAKVGTNYIYGYKYEIANWTKVNQLARQYPNVFTSKYINKIKNRGMIGKLAVDCSGLISAYTKKVLGSAQLYSQAYARLPIANYKQFAVGTVLWKQGHVGVYLGDGLVAEAKGIDYGTIISKVSDTKWVNGLTFSWINYDIKEPVASSAITYKGKNPYPVPTGLVKIGMTGDSVKWLQWELAEAGYTINISGKFDNTTKDILKDFQKSAKLVVDGICGPKSIAALVGNNLNVGIDDKKETAAPVQEAPKAPEISIEEAARKIIAQEEGWKVCGAARTAKLKKLGLDPKAVQARINEIIKGSK